MSCSVITIARNFFGLYFVLASKQFASAVCLHTYSLTVGWHFVSLQALKLKVKARKNPITKGTCLVYMALNKCLSVVILSGFSPLPCPRVVSCVFDCWVVLFLPLFPINVSLAFLSTPISMLSKLQIACSFFSPFSLHNSWCWRLETKFFGPLSSTLFSCLTLPLLVKIPKGILLHFETHKKEGFMW